MCGIIGIASNKSVTASIIQSLKKLEYRGYDSSGIATIVDGYIDEKMEEEMTKEFINFYSNNMNKGSKLITGALEFLSWCKNNSISMAVCTNKQEHLSIDLLKKIKIYHFFDYVAGGNTFNHNKPDPKHLTDTIEIIGGNLKKTIMIGDSETDSGAAQAANIPFVLIEGGYTVKKVNQIYHNHLVKNFVGLEKIISKYLND